MNRSGNDGSEDFWGAVPVELFDVLKVSAAMVRKVLFYRVC